MEKTFKKFKSLFICNWKSFYFRITFLFFVAFLVMIDRLTKSYLFGPNDSNFDLKIIAINVKWTLNSGAAFNNFLNKTGFLQTVGIIFFVTGVVLTFTKIKWFYLFSILAIASGAFGNVLDRFLYDGNVRDFLSFSWWESFPIFNFADCCVILGVFSLSIILIVRMFI